MVTYLLIGWRHNDVIGWRHNTTSGLKLPTYLLLSMHLVWIVLKTDWIKLDPQGWVSSWTSPLNPRPCHASWPQGKATQGKHKVSTGTYSSSFVTVIVSYTVFDIKRDIGKKCQFLPRDAYAQRGLCRGKMSVHLSPRPSVCHTPVLCRNGYGLNISSKFFHHRVARPF